MQTLGATLKFVNECVISAHPATRLLRAGRARDAAEAARELAERFKALADPTRLAIVNQLAGADEVCVCHLVPDAGLSQPTISHHLRLLRDAGLVTSERRGTWAYYRLVPGRRRARRRARRTPGDTCGFNRRRFVEEAVRRSASTRSPESPGLNDAAASLEEDHVAQARSRWPSRCAGRRRGNRTARATRDSPCSPGTHRSGSSRCQRPRRPQRARSEVGTRRPGHGRGQRRTRCSPRLRDRHSVQRPARAPPSPRSRRRGARPDDARRGAKRPSARSSAPRSRRSRSRSRSPGVDLADRRPVVRAHHGELETGEGAHAAFHGASACAGSRPITRSEPEHSGSTTCTTR